MKYTVIWRPVAEQELAAIWTKATNRISITAAAHQIDQILQSNPNDQGASRWDDARILLSAPLGVLFTVDIENRIVSVGSVWRFAKRSHGS